MGKRKYSGELKMEVVQAVLEGSKTVDELAREYVLHKALISKWVGAYQQNGIEGVERKFTTYTPEFKLQVIEDMQTNHLSYRATASKYNVGMHTSIKQWERVYLEDGYEGLKRNRRGLPGEPRAGRPPTLRQDVQENLIAENQRLKMENDYLKKLNALIRSKGK